MSSSHASSSGASGGPLGTFDKWFSYLENVLTLIAAAFIMMLMFLLCGEVIGRRLFNQPIPGTIDYVEVWMAMFCFLPVAYCQRVGGHVRMELVIGKLKGRIYWALECFAVVIALIYIVIIIDKSWEHFMRAWTYGDSTIDVQLLTWPSKIIVPIALSVLAVRLVLQIIGYARMAIDPSKEPVAVPLIKDPATIAREEIEEALGSDAKDLPTGGNPPRGQN